MLYIGLRTTQILLGSQRKREWQKNVATISLILTKSEAKDDRASKVNRDGLVEKTNVGFNRLVNSGPLPIVDSKQKIGLALVISSNGVQRQTSKNAIKKYPRIEKSNKVTPDLDTKMGCA